MIIDELVEEKLKEFSPNSGALELWKEMIQWYEEGGPEIVKKGILTRMKKIKDMSEFQNKIREEDTS
jgi:hypothetical protein